MALLSNYISGGSGGGGTDKNLVQVAWAEVNAGASSHVSNYNNSYTSMGGGVTITPKSYSNKIIIEIYPQMARSHANSPMEWVLYRSGTGLTDGYLTQSYRAYGSGKYVYGNGYYSGGSWRGGKLSHLDGDFSSATASITYTPYFRSYYNNSSYPVYAIHQGHSTFVVAKEYETVVEEDV